MVLILKELDLPVITTQKKPAELASCLFDPFAFGFVLKSSFQAVRLALGKFRVFLLLLIVFGLYNTLNRQSVSHALLIL